jgi:hypothetical protein
MELRMPPDYKKFQYSFAVIYQIIQIENDFIKPWSSDVITKYNNLRKESSLVFNSSSSMLPQDKKKLFNSLYKEMIACIREIYRLEYTATASIVLNELLMTFLKKYYDRYNSLIEELCSISMFFDKPFYVKSHH